MPSRVFRVAFVYVLDISAVFLVEFGNKMIDEQRDIFFALPEEGGLGWENIEAVKQIFPKPASADLFLQITGR